MSGAGGALTGGYGPFVPLRDIDTDELLDGCEVTFDAGGRTSHGTFVAYKEHSMTRISKIPSDQWDPRIRDAVKPEQLTDLEQGLTRIFAHVPDMALALMGFGGALKKQRTLSERLVELVRLRVAFFNQCRSCMAIRYRDAVADGVTEDLVCSLERPEDAANLTPAEKVAVRYGELMATDHLAIDDALYDELREHFTEAQIVELGMICAFFVGFGRLAATYHMVEELPDPFRNAPHRISPWGNEATVVR